MTDNEKVGTVATIGVSIFLTWLLTRKKPDSGNAIVHVTATTDLIGTVTDNQGTRLIDGQWVPFDINLPPGEYVMGLDPGLHG